MSILSFPHSQGEMADTNNYLYAYSQRRCAADKNTRGNPVNQVYPQACGKSVSEKKHVSSVFASKNQTNYIIVLQRMLRIIHVEY